MTKIMVVEDDVNLREIYGVRLQAEGFEVVQAQDGEDALSKVLQEKPDLVLSDVMMPRISGFDMLDILRSTPETAHLKIIMLTALNDESQRTRGESLGANRYLVKSQTGIDDIVAAVKELLAEPAGEAPSSAETGPGVASAEAAAPETTPTPVAAPTTPPTPTSPTPPVSTSAPDSIPEGSPETPTTPAPTPSPVSAPTENPVESSAGVDISSENPSV